MNDTESTQELRHPFNFDDFANLLAPLGTLNSPSELHGLLCGKLSGGAALSETQWLLDAVEFLDFMSAPDENVRVALTHLYQNTLAEFQGDFSLKIILPDDDTSLNDRAQCLSEWCHGFLTGFGSVELSKPRHIEPEDAEMLEDIARIVQVQIDEDELASNAEADFTEIVEYVRMVASSLYFEYAPKSLEDKNETAAGKTLH
jgi:uncharacterized protein YgfB (UPF0149 family)